MTSRTDQPKKKSGGLAGVVAGRCVPPPVPGLGVAGRLGKPVEGRVLPGRPVFGRPALGRLVLGRVGRLVGRLIEGVRPAAGRLRFML